MEKIKFYFILAFCLMMCSCGTTSKMSKSAISEIGEEVEISIPIKSEYLYDTDTAIRSVANGISSDLNVARNVCFINCSGNISLRINGNLRIAIENYAKQHSAKSDKIIERDLKQVFEQYIITFSEADITNMVELENHITRNSKTYEYTYWMAMEVNKDEIVNRLINKFDNLPNNVKETIEYDKEKFKEYLSKNIFK